MTDSRQEARESLLRWGQGRLGQRGSDRGQQHMLDLDDAYPEVDIFGPQCISASVGAGWKGLVSSCLEALRTAGCKAGQIKQKFGELRVYWDYPEHIEAALAKWREIPTAERVQIVTGEDGVRSVLYLVPLPYAEERERIDAIVKPAIAEASRLSYLTCEDCSAALDRGGPCFRTQCQACKDLDQKELGRERRRG